MGRQIFKTKFCFKAFKEGQHFNYLLIITQMEISHTRKVPHFQIFLLTLLKMLGGKISPLLLPSKTRMIMIKVSLRYFIHFKWTLSNYRIYLYRETLINIREQVISNPLNIPIQQSIRTRAAQIVDILRRNYLRVKTKDYHFNLKLIS